MHTTKLATIVILFVFAFALLGCSEETKDISQSSTASHEKAEITSSPMTPIDLEPTGTLPPIITIEQLFYKVEDCELPCLISINPGQTNWDASVRLIQGFNGYTKQEVIAINGKQQEFLTWHYPDLSNSEFGGFIASEDGVVTKMKLLIEKRKSDQYSIKDILQSNGPPDQILLSTISNSITPTWRLSIFMLYPSQKFVVFSGLEASREGETVVGCKEFDSVGIFSYSGDIHWTEESISELFFGRASSFKIMPLSETTSLDNESFLALFMEEEKKENCIHTPSSIWE